MALHPALERLIQTKLAHTHKPQWALPIGELGQAFRDLWTPAITGDPVSVSRIEAISVPCPDSAVRVRVYGPERNEVRPIMLYFHGGGYVQGGIEDTHAVCRRLARTSRHVVLSVAYRFAPEHPFPAALDDAYAIPRRQRSMH